MEHYKIVFSGLRLLPSFVPTYSAGAISNDMDIFERTWNFFTYQWTTALYEWYYLPKMESTYREALGQDVPSVREIERNASLVLNNAHFSLSYPRPQLPQVVDVGGMHCRAGQPLPQDLLDFVESSGSEGFIYFSMGSIVKIQDMPQLMLQDFIKVFARIKQKVIWKSEEDKIEGLSKNVKLVKWAPQQDLLAHPKIKIFLTHGGFLSMEEAIYHGVPLIGFPLYGDQISAKYSIRNI
jgi:glucuronosyltransferase